MSTRRIRTAIRAEFKAGRVTGTGRIENVSEGGLFVGTREVPEQGEMVTLRFRGPGCGALEISGLVWWTARRGSVRRSAGFGLRLLEESPGYDALLDALA